MLPLELWDLGMELQLNQTIHMVCVHTFWSTRLNYVDCTAHVYGPEAPAGDIDNVDDAARAHRSGVDGQVP